MSVIYNFNPKESDVLLLYYERQTFYGRTY
jgi:hypothetical protein